MPKIIPKTTRVSNYSMPNAIDDLVADLTALQTLDKGWDGEDAERPNAPSIHQAILFVCAVGGWSLNLEASLHVDGSVILDLSDGAEGLLRFPGDNTIVYVTGTAFGRIAFDGGSVPDELKPMLDAWRTKSKGVPPEKTPP